MKKVYPGIVGFSFQAVFVPATAGYTDYTQGPAGVGVEQGGTPAHFKYILLAHTAAAGEVFNVNLPRQWARTPCCVDESYDYASDLSPAITTDVDLVHSMNRLLCGQDVLPGRPFVSFSERDVKVMRDGVVPVPDFAPPELLTGPAPPARMTMA